MHLIRLAPPTSALGQYERPPVGIRSRGRVAMTLTGAFAVAAGAVALLARSGSAPGWARRHHREIAAGAIGLTIATGLGALAWTLSGPPGD